MDKNRTAIVIISGMLIMLTACATTSSSPGSPGSAGSFQPGGGASAAAASPTAASTTSGVVHFPFPADVHIEFQTPLPADQQQAAAVVADDDYELAYLYAIYSDAKNMSVLKYVDRLVPATYTATVVAVDNQKSTAFTGTERIYDTTARPTAGEPAELTVSSCVNSVALQSTNRSTGQIVPGQSTSPEQNVWLESDTLFPVGGAWKIISTSHVYYPHGAAKGCYP
jgi:hypothetical protein